MAESSISVAVRIRPFSAKESAQLAPVDKYQPFLGDGGLSAGPASPSKAAVANGTSGVASTGTGPSLRTKYLRSIVTAVDDKVLIFDPPQHNPYAAASSSAPNTFAHGARRARDVRYAFDRVFDDTCGQETIFENTTKPLLDGILNGFNATVFAYGATGCGKTHTISGTPSDPGVIFLTMRELYNRIEESRQESDVQVRLSYLEIYNEQIRDLLSPAPTPSGAGLMLREDAANRISVVGITEHTPASPQHVLEMIQEGNLRRTMSPTEANAVSSRSHAVLQINVTQRPRTADTVMETTSASLNIIDLAGSERAAATRNDGARMKEGANINKSLLALGNCINALCQTSHQRNRHIPYRNSKLTRLLKFSLGGNCKTVMIVCVSPSSAHYDETYNTLKYANQAKNIRTKVSRNMLNVDRHVAQYVQAIHELKEEVTELKAKLADRAAVESLAEKRRKSDMRIEMASCIAKMRERQEAVKALLSHGAGMEALLMAANVRAVALRQRLAVLEEQTHSMQNSADVESEKQVLRKLIGRQEAILADRTMQNDSHSIETELQALRSTMSSIASNEKFDDDVKENLRFTSDALMADIEMHRAKVMCETMSKQLGAGMAVLADFAVLGVRSTLALKEAATAVHSAELDKNAFSVQVKAVAKMNDDMFSRHVGVQTADASLQNAELRTSVLQRAARMSTAPSNQSTISVSNAPPARTVGRRPSRSSLMPSAATSLTGAHTKTARRTSMSTSMRRTSLGLRRVSATNRRPSQNVNENTAVPETVAAHLPPAKKNFRWADEAGEGQIDDKKPTEAQSSARPSVGPSRAIRHSLTASTMGGVQGAVNLLNRADSMELGGATAASNSSAEWEDLSKEANHVSDQSHAKEPLAPSTHANGATATDGRKRETNSLFEHNFLRKKNANVESNEKPSSSCSDESMGDDDSIEASYMMYGDNKDPDSVTNILTLDAVQPLQKRPKDLAHAAPTRSSPYRRPSHPSTKLTATADEQVHAGVGPMRTKARSSGGDANGGDQSIAKKTAVNPSQAKHRTAAMGAAQPIRR